MPRRRAIQELIATAGRAGGCGTDASFKTSRWQRKGRFGPLDRAERGRQILAQGHEPSEGARAQRYLIAVVDGLKGFPEAITSVFPPTLVQTCIVHLIRNSLSFVTWKDRKAILPSIQAIYRAENADMAIVRLEEFEAKWGKRYPAIGQAWRRAWENVIPFFAFVPGIRKMIYTSNAVEALNRSLRKIIKTCGSFPNDEAALKLLYVAIRN